MNNWDDLRIFLAVARAEGLSAAARMLKLDPATVGRKIARMEEGLGVSLFTRSPQGYAMTDEGQKLFTHASEVEHRLTIAQDDVQGSAGQLTGQVRVGAPDGSANYILPQVTAAIMEANPGLEIQIVALPRVFNLSRREADMAIAVSMPATGRLMVQRITDYKLHLAASESYLASHAPIHRREDLRDHRIVGYIPDMIHDPELDYLDGLGLSAAAFGSNSVSVQMNWLRQGAGLGVAHDFAVALTPGLQKVLEDEISLTRSLYLIRHGDDRKLERLNRFAQLLIEGVKAEVDRLEQLV